MLFFLLANFLKALFSNAMVFVCELDCAKQPRRKFEINIIHLHINTNNCTYITHVTKATIGVAAYHQIHDITNENASDRKEFYA